MAKKENIYITKQGLEKLKKELEYLKKTKKIEIAQRLNQAIEYGDLSENSEYQEAKEEQAFTESRILELEDMIKRSIIIKEAKKKSHKTISIGDTVTIKELDDKSNKSKSYRIVGATESDPLSEDIPSISNVSPIGAGILHKTVGETIKINTPSGVLNIKILDIK